MYHIYASIFLQFFQSLLPDQFSVFFQLLFMKNAHRKSPQPL